MRPFLASFLIVFSINIALNYGLSDRATLGSRLIRGLSSTTQKRSTEKQDTVSKDIKNQMQRIDALEDIFIGSSGSGGAKKKKKAAGPKSARRSSVDDIGVLDKDLSEVTDEVDLGDVEKTLKVRSEEGRRLKREIHKDKTKQENDKKNSKKKDLALEKELSDDKGTGYSDKDDSDSSSKKSTIPADGKIEESEDTKSDGDLMGGAGAMSDDPEDDYSEDENTSEEQKYENDEKEYDDEKNDDKSKSEDSESDAGVDNSENDEDNRKSEIKENFKKNDDSEREDGEKKSAIDNSVKPTSDAEEKSDRKEPSFDDDYADKKSDGLSDTTDTKVSCRTECAPVMDYETCAVPRCDYKVGTIKDLCQYLCHHQKERCEEICE